MTSHEITGGRFMTEAEYLAAEAAEKAKETAVSPRKQPKRMMLFRQTG
ncbi:MAG: hypothetical protein R3D55_25345 [Chloroflexota bacterium]